MITFLCPLMSATQKKLTELGNVKQQSQTAPTLQGITFPQRDNKQHNFQTMDITEISERLQIKVKFIDSY